MAASSAASVSNPRGRPVFGLLVFLAIPHFDTSEPKRLEIPEPALRVRGAHPCKKRKSGQPPLQKDLKVGPPPTQRSVKQQAITWPVTLTGEWMRRFSQRGTAPMLLFELARAIVRR